MDNRLFLKYEELSKKINNNNYVNQDLIDFNKLSTLLARYDFTIFCTLMMSRRGYEWQWFHKYTMGRLQSKIFPTNDYDKEHPRMVLRIADQHGKTTAMMLFIAWCLGIKTNWRIIYLSYSDIRASQVTTEVINLLIEPIYKSIFPEFKLSDEMEHEREAEKTGQKLSKREFTNAGSPKTGTQGKFIAAGLTGSYLGNSGDLIIVDDALNGWADAKSQVIRESKWDVFTGSVLSRQQSYTPIIVAGTWWHLEDIIGRIQTIYIEKEDRLESGTAKWEVVEFNAQKDERDYSYDNRKFGEYLWPGRKQSYYLDLKLTNPKMWQIKAQNLPMMGEGVLFQPSSFRYYDFLPFSIERSRIIISIDSNYKNKETSDRSGITIWAFHDKKAYLLKFWWQRYSLDKLLTFSQSLIQNEFENYYTIVIEMKASGQGFVDMANKYGIYRITEFEPNDKLWNGSKYYRAELALPFFDAGQVYLPSSNICPDINTFVNQHLMFDGEDGGKDDLVDSGVQCILKFQNLLRGAKLVVPSAIDKSIISNQSIFSARNSSRYKSLGGNLIDRSRRR